MSSLGLQITSMSNIKQNILNVRKQITEIADACNRQPEDIRLIAVSKTKPIEAIREAQQTGQRDFGENYLQEAIDKIQDLQDLDIIWHFIGAIQSNKTRHIAENFAWVHTLSSLKHAQRLDQQRPVALAKLNVCIQVNLSGETSKNGITTQQLIPLARELSNLPNLRLRGLMTMPDPSSSQQQQLAVFSQLASLKNELEQADFHTDTLSMGMSGDIESAIKAGSTMIRIGTAIFGKRDT